MPEITLFPPETPASPHSAANEQQTCFSQQDGEIPCCSARLQQPPKQAQAQKGNKPPLRAFPSVLPPPKTAWLKLIKKTKHKNQPDSALLTFTILQLPASQRGRRERRLLQALAPREAWGLRNPPKTVHGWPLVGQRGLGGGVTAHAGGWQLQPNALGRQQSFQLLTLQTPKRLPQHRRRAMGGRAQDGGWDVGRPMDQGNLPSAPRASWGPRSRPPTWFLDPNGRS